MPALTAYHHYAPLIRMEAKAIYIAVDGGRLKDSIRLVYSRTEPKSLTFRGIESCFLVVSLLRYAHHV